MTDLSIKSKEIPSMKKCEVRIDRMRMDDLKNTSKSPVLSMETAAGPDGSATSDFLECMTQMTQGGYGENDYMPGDTFNAPGLKAKSVKGLKFVEAKCEKFLKDDDEMLSFYKRDNFTEPEPLNTELKVTVHADATVYGLDEESTNKMLANVNKLLLPRFKRWTYMRDCSDMRVSNLQIVRSDAEIHVVNATIHLNSRRRSEFLGKVVDSIFHQNYWNKHMNKIIKEGVCYVKGKVPQKLIGSLEANIDKVVEHIANIKDSNEEEYNSCRNEEEYSSKEEHSSLNEEEHSSLNEEERSNRNEEEHSCRNEEERNCRNEEEVCSRNEEEENSCRNEEERNSPNEEERNSSRNEEERKSCPNEEERNSCRNEEELSSRNEEERNNRNEEEYSSQEEHSNRNEEERISRNEEGNSHNEEEQEGGNHGDGHNVGDDNLAEGDSSGEEYNYEQQHNYGGDSGIEEEDENEKDDGREEDISDSDMEDFGDIEDHNEEVDNQIDPVDPDLYPYIKDVSKIKENLGKPLEGLSWRWRFYGNTKNIWGHTYRDSMFQWLPTPFKVSNEGKCEIQEYINNLDRQLFPGLYRNLEQLFEIFLPNFEEVWSYTKAMKFYVCDNDDKSEDEEEHNEEEHNEEEHSDEEEDNNWREDYIEEDYNSSDIDDMSDMDNEEKNDEEKNSDEKDQEIPIKEEDNIEAELNIDIDDTDKEEQNDKNENDSNDKSLFVKEPVSFKGMELQIIVRILDNKLEPNKSFEEVWHAEGLPHENIIMTGIYFLDRSSDIEGGDLLFKRPFTKDEQNRLWNIPEVVPIVPSTFAVEGFTPLGRFPTEEGYLLVFPNCHIHKISRIVNNSAGKEVARRRLIMFLFVDPEKKMISTREVAPQQTEIPLAKAKNYKHELLKERKHDMRGREYFYNIAYCNAIRKRNKSMA